MPQRVYDPQGALEVLTKQGAARVKNLAGLRLAVLDNTKWNAAKLLDGVVDLLTEKVRFSEVNRYKKETFTKPASAALIAEIAANNDVALIAIAD